MQPSVRTSTRTENRLHEFAISAKGLMRTDPSRHFTHALGQCVSFVSQSGDIYAFASREPIDITRLRTIRSNQSTWFRPRCDRPDLSRPQVTVGLWVGVAGCSGRFPQLADSGGLNDGSGFTQLRAYHHQRYPYLSRPRVVVNDLDLIDSLAEVLGVIRT